ncbi:thiamine pyrophosphate-requiring protein [Mesorhizobium sp. CGMCC 1.15528]|uniref:Thiamine pyrophosphate-requiring protein n=1 Tax=Mesorhizobium zhangyense TaxID=1776730 RepID=A0A7C9VAT8_9HYPH|nr:thiamine pyrophosphate-requiring protein [Mesorhizobium zhangyense]NGN41147.1 thiamine pyrophosphate-requiring protein [Mesorhizobium zhangyense]
MNKRETVKTGTMTAGGALLARLKAVGVDYIFANSGTDFPPIIEGLAEAEARGIPLPQALVMPHESAAMGMAHGYYLATGRPQAVMAHTNVGLANCAIGAINAATEHIPMLLFSGRTPTTEKGHLGSRTVPIGWGQEMRDQAALVREACKWDYELRFPEQVPEIVDRAYAIASSEPRGPVYVSLPREVLCETCPTEGLDKPATMAPARAGARPADIEAAAAILAAARHPVIFAQRGAGDDAGFEALSALAQEWAIPVCQYWAVQLAIPTDHPMTAGPDPKPLLEQADAILVIDALAPWSPDIHRPRDDCRIIHLGQDPLYSRFPVRSFRSDISLACDVSEGIQALRVAMEPLRAEAIAARRDLIAGANAHTRAAAIATAERGNGAPMSKDWVSLCLSRAIEGREATVLSELGCPMGPMTLKHRRAWYQEPHSGGLGWSFPAGLGMQLADRERLVIATMGDGSYIFSNPVACHQIAEALELPLLVIIVNNAEWGAVRQSVLGIYPDGHAARTNRMPLTGLSPIPDFTKVAAASRAWARTVTDGAVLEEALSDAIRHIETHRTLALLDVHVRP